MSTYEERQAIRDANPGVIVEEDSVYNPSTGETQPISAYTGGGGGDSTGDSGGGGEPTQNTHPAASGYNAYGDPIFNTPNGPKTGTQITQELAAAGWDGQGDPVAVYNHVAGGGTGQPGSTAATPATAATAAATQQAGAQQYAAAIQQMLNAMASGNRDAFNRAVHEFDVVFQLDRDKFADDVRRFDLNFGVTQAGLTGMYQGNATLPAMTSYANQFGQWGVPTPGQQTLAAQNQYFQQGLSGVTLAAGMQANPFRQQQVLGQLGSLYGGGGVAGFQAPNTVAGVGTAGGNTRGGLGYMQQMIDDIRDPTANQTNMNQILDATPTPNKLNSVDFLRAAPSTQSMVLQAMQEKYGLDPGDAVKQIQNTLPKFQAPSTMGGLRR